VEKVENIPGGRGEGEGEDRGHLGEFSFPAFRPEKDGPLDDAITVADKHRNLARLFARQLERTARREARENRLHIDRPEIRPAPRCDRAFVRQRNRRAFSKRFGLPQFARD